MKLWEVLKELDENPKKVFESNYVQKRHRIMADERGYLHLEIFDIYGVLIPHELGGGGFNGNIRVSATEWQEVKQPVPWQEAIEAWVNGKTIKSIREGGEAIYQGWREFLICRDGEHIDKDEIKNGTWYIED